MCRAFLFRVGVAPETTRNLTLRLCPVLLLWSCSNIEDHLVLRAILVQFYSGPAMRLRGVAGEELTLEPILYFFEGVA